MKKSIHVNSPKTTKSIARELARTILDASKKRGAFVIALVGQLGAGKTSFVQGLAKELGVKKNVLSPTFLIIKSYDLKKKRKLYHIDCYRLHNTKELLDLGWKEIISNKENIVAIEWADKIKSIIPKDALWISFVQGSELTERDIVIG
ncbi:MAG: tRNA (adenosine(37)-N6)-threonylcarbamoyltransferase complex ATPase subunit type 1 TsaE [bacterium]|nr:tRNA (adenosine(37)-N6)-threonylcarbamoyltransferase complex ATPase subunit type 1 TsaE [bacterium]